MVSIEFVKQEFPLHYLVWNNFYKELEEEIVKKENDKEKRDPRGRTPLMLAVTLGHLESVRLLLNNDANVNCESAEGWTVVQEAVATGDPELLQMVLERREHQRYTNRMAGIPELLQRLNQAPDFYVEMKWEFTSWVPLVSRMCPSDTYKVYKQGSNVRIDTTLLGFDHTNWQRGNRSYVFKGQSDGATIMMEVDHDTRQVYVERMQMVAPTPLDEQRAYTTDEMVSHRLTSPIVTTFVDTDKIAFERNKAGMWGWRSDKSEQVNGHECKVFGATNVELVTKTRTEHLTESDKAKSRSPKTPLQSFLGIAESEQQHQQQQQQQQQQGVGVLLDEASATTTNNTMYIGNPCDISAEEYFDADRPLTGGRDIGRPREINNKVHRFRATLWLAENYPLSLQEQIMPIVDLMAITSTHFAKLKDFIQMQLPSGFPVKIEIPLFHVMNARITFGNIFAIDSETAVSGVARIHEDAGRITCIVDDACFATPPGYTLAGATDARRQFSVEEEDDLLQFAIQQSLIEAGTEREEVDIWEALKGQKPSRPTTPNLISEEERQLQRAIQASLALYQRSLGGDDDTDVIPACAAAVAAIEPSTEECTSTNAFVDMDLEMALMLSNQQRKEEEERRLQEQKMLDEILQLSLTDK